MAEEKKPILELSRLQEKHLVWSIYNFITAPEEEDMFKGIVEETGELSRVLLKSKQAIRGWDDHSKRLLTKKDAVGDILIYIMGFCSANGWDFGEVLTETLNSVLKRDWKKYPKTGFSEPEEAGGD